MTSFITSLIYVTWQNENRYNFFSLFDRFWQMTQICQIIFCEFFKKKNSHFLGTTLVTSSPLVMTSNIYVTNDVIAHVLWVKWSQTIFFRKVLFNAVILVYWLSRSVKKQKSYGILKMTKIAMTSYTGWLFERGPVLSWNISNTNWGTTKYHSLKEAKIHRILFDTGVEEIRSLLF